MGLAAAFRYPELPHLPQPFCLFCLSSFVPTADSIGSASPKKEAVLGLGAYLLAFFVQLLGALQPLRRTSHDERRRFP
ncbi:hypothetical protein Trisim1_005020 [Trichoderma cf. simile WF8]